tara:strand:+ start:168 stop:434 length:267 start_codon:yes stop_codon:yes gene_type:complete
MNNFTIEDHTRLRDRVNEIDKAGGKFMISYDYRPEVKELYKQYNTQVLNMRYTGATKAARSTERKEYIIMNYEPVSQIEIFKETKNEE